MSPLIRPYVRHFSRFHLSSTSWLSSSITLPPTLDHSNCWSATSLRRTSPARRSTLRSGSPLALEYSDYSAWQRESGIPETVRSYWMQALEGLPEQVTLPLDRPRSTSARASSCRVEISRSVRTGLQTLARSNNATMFMVVHAALAALLARYNGSNDVAVGTVVSGRVTPELDELVGMFAGTIVLRTEVDPSNSFGPVGRAGSSA